MRVGDPLDAQTDLGPLFSAGQRAVTETYLSGSACAGTHDSSVAASGRGQRGFFLTPAIVTGVETTDRCWREEIFGPGRLRARLRR